MSNKALGPRAAALHEAIKEVAAYERGEVKLNTIEVGMSEKQPEALSLAAILEMHPIGVGDREAAALLRTQHTDIERTCPFCDESWVEQAQAEAVPQLDRKIESRLDDDIASVLFEVERAIENSTNDVPWQIVSAFEAYEAARRLLPAQQAQAEAVPVAWIRHDWSGTGQRTLSFEGPTDPAPVRDEVVSPVWTPLFAAPQQAELDDHLKMHAVEELCQLGYTVKDGELFPPDHLHKLMEAAQHPLALTQQAEAVPQPPEDWHVFNTGAEVASNLTWAEAWDYMTPERIARGWTAVCVASKDNLPAAPQPKEQSNGQQ